MKNIDEDLSSVVRAAIHTISEHCDSVLILACLERDGRTAMIEDSRGNAYANVGMALQWLDTQREFDRIRARGKDQ